MIRTPRFVFFLFSFVLSGCACLGTKIPVTGNLGPYSIRTTVDSEIARYYLENYLAGKNTIPELNARLDQLDHEHDGRELDRDSLKKISANFDSVDFAALFWGHHVLKTKNNARIQKQFLENLASVQKRITVPTSGYVVLLAPGLDYKENGHATGADLKTQVDLFRNLGVDVHFIDLSPMGTVEENALVIAEGIRKQTSRKVLIGGPSSAGPAIHLALAKTLTENEVKNVAVWFSLGGVINGSPVLDYMDSGLRYPLWRSILLFKGWNADTFTSLQAAVSRKRAENLRVPSHIKVVSYIGLSLSGNISEYAKDKYCLMRDEGPNDGLALLPDMVVRNSLTIIAPTSDHFFAEDPLIKEKSLALLKTAIQLMGS